MTDRRKIALAAAVAALTLSTPMAVNADEPVRIGMVTTLSTDAGYLGEDIRDGFLLAMEHVGDGDSLGGIPVELLVEDDARDPQRGRQVAERFMLRDRVDLMTGIVFSNVAEAVIPSVVREGTIYISPNAGPSLLAGRGCHENYFNTAWQNDNLHEAVGQYVSQQDHESAFILAPNYAAGRDALEGFKRFFDGEVVEEVYTTLGQSDYASEIARIRAAEPDAVFFFLPGGMGISFVQQYAQAGLKDAIPVYGSGFSFDQRLVEAVGEAAEGIINSSQWSRDLDNDANRRFVEDFVATYDRLPTLYASQGYDTAMLIAGALEAVDGDAGDIDALREALRAADFDSVRGSFRFGNNHHPIQNIYIREVYRDDNGVMSNRIVDIAFEDHQDAYASDCSM